MHRAPPNVTGAPSDAAAVRTLLLRTIADSERSPIQVDPRPLPRNLDAPGASLPATAAARDRAAYEMGVDLVGAAKRTASKGIQDACASTASPPGSDKSGCPADAFVILVVGQPTMTLSQCVTADFLQRDAVQGSRCMSVRGMVMHVSHYGFNIVVNDYLFEHQRRGDWRFVRQMFEGIVE
ncbi:MAG TPA: hypothetical protein VII52_11135 [Gemmatimonadaceae bacterium]